MWVSSTKCRLISRNPRRSRDSSIFRNAAFLKDLCAELKRACGTGGAVFDDTIELQGDLRDRVRDYLLKKNFAVKG